MTTSDRERLVLRARLRVEQPGMTSEETVEAMHAKFMLAHRVRLMDVANIAIVMGASEADLAGLYHSHMSWAQRFEANLHRRNYQGACGELFFHPPVDPTLLALLRAALDSFALSPLELEADGLREVGATISEQDLASISEQDL